MWISWHGDIEKDLKKFAEFYLLLLEEIGSQLDSIKHFIAPNNTIILERFNKNVQQASVEAFAIERRHVFLGEAFDYYLKHNKIVRS